MLVIRLKFKRTDDLRFLAHKEQVKLFERAMRRCQLPLYFSQGFNPHPVISFAIPLSVGMTSDKEYVDVRLDVDDIDEYYLAQFKKNINRIMPKGLKILDVEKLPKQAAKLTRIIHYADYEVRCLGLHVSDFDVFQEQLNEFENKESIMIKKRSKKGKLLDMDVRKNFITISAEKDQKDVIFRLRIVPISGSMLNPEHIVTAFLQSINYYNKSLSFFTHRADLKLHGYR